MIKIVLLDIDGVLTDGKVTIDSQGNETKTIDFKDIDAVFELKRRGVLIGLITGEATPITCVFNQRFKPDFFYNGCKDKVQAFEDILAKAKVTQEEVCFVGDSKHDIKLLKMVGLPVCPANAVAEVKTLAAVCLKTKGGNGCILELLESGVLTSPSNVSG